MESTLQLKKLAKKAFLKVLSAFSKATFLLYPIGSIAAPVECAQAIFAALTI